MKCKVTGRVWDCLKEGDRDWARRMVHRDWPGLLVICPPCTLFSTLQNLSPNGLPPIPGPERWNEAVVMLEFAGAL